MLADSANHLRVFCNRSQTYCLVRLLLLLMVRPSTRLVEISSRKRSDLTSAPLLDFKGVIDDPARQTALALQRRDVLRGKFHQLCFCSLVRGAPSRRRAALCVHKESFDSVLCHSSLFSDELHHCGLVTTLCESVSQAHHI